MMQANETNQLQAIEYNNLCQEILANSVRVDTALNICIIGTTTLIGYFLTRGITVWSPFLLFIPFSVLLPTIKYVIASLNSTARIASYISVFYEQEFKGIAWQSRIQKFRALEKLGKVEKRFRGFRKGLITIFTLFGLACMLLSIILLFSELKSWINEWNWEIRSTIKFYYIVLLGYIILLIGIVYFWQKFMRQLGKTLSSDWYEKVIDTWDKMKKNEQMGQD